MMPSVLQLIIVNYTGMNLTEIWMTLLEQFACVHVKRMT